MKPTVLSLCPLLLGLLLSLSAPAAAATCGAACKQSTECEAPCDLCGMTYTDAGPQTVCGRQCGANCTRNSECFNNEYLCAVCYKNPDDDNDWFKCTPHWGQSPQESRWNATCIDDTDCCGKDTICATCIAGPGAPKTCLSKCGAKCARDSGCVEGNCVHCAHRDQADLTSLSCGPQATCGAFCVGPHHSDCRQDGAKTPCPVCNTKDGQTTGTCGVASCGMKCDGDVDCASSPENCTLCLNGQCIKPAHACGDKCSTSDECQFLPTCKYCINGGCHTQPAKCGDACDNNGQCYYVPYCPICLSGACSPLSCGMNCTSDTQCPHPSAVAAARRSLPGRQGIPVLSAAPNCSTCWQGHCDQCQGNRCGSGGSCPDGCECQFSFCALPPSAKKFYP